MSGDDKQLVLDSLEALLTELHAGNPPWENVTLADYLESMHAWLRSHPAAKGPASYALVAQMLVAATIYE